MQDNIFMHIPLAGVDSVESWRRIASAIIVLKEAAFLSSDQLLSYDPGVGIQVMESAQDGMNKLGQALIASAFVSAGVNLAKFIEEQDQDYPESNSSWSRVQLELEAAFPRIVPRKE